MSAVIDDLSTQAPVEKLKIFDVYFEYTGPITGTIPNLIRYRSAMEVINSSNTPDGSLLVKPSLIVDAFSFWLHNEYLSKKQQQESKLKRNANKLICINAAGKNFFDSDNLFLKELPSWNTSIDTEFSALDPSLDYLYPDKDDKVPSFRTCLERAGLYDKEKEYNCRERAIAWTMLIRRKFPKNKVS
jgi:hypothetical protein